MLFSTSENSVVYHDFKSSDSMDNSYKDIK